MIGTLIPQCSTSEGRFSQYHGIPRTKFSR